MLGAVRRVVLRVVTLTAPWASTGASRRSGLRRNARRGGIVHGTIAAMNVTP